MAGVVGRVDGQFGGGRAKMSQPPPASTDGNSRTSLTNARTASASLLKMIAWAPVIMPSPL